MTNKSLLDIVSSSFFGFPTDVMLPSVRNPPCPQAKCPPNTGRAGTERHRIAYCLPKGGGDKTLLVEAIALSKAFPDDMRAHWYKRMAHQELTWRPLFSMPPHRRRSHGFLESPYAQH